MGALLHKGPAQEPYEITWQLRQIIQRWKLTQKDMHYLFHKFQALDADNSGTIEFQEFFSFIKEPRNAFLDTMFRLIVQDQDALDFAAWLQVVFAFCLSTKLEMIEQVFQAFDTNHNGFIELAELHNFLVAIHGENAIFPKEVVQALTQKSLKQEGRIDFDDFVEAERQHPMLLWPVFRIQHRMRKKTLGIKFFQTIDARIAETYSTDPHARYLERKWRDRIDCFKLYCLGWSCCARPDDKTPTPYSELQARKMAMRKMTGGMLRRRVRVPQLNQYRPLPQAPYHTVEDDVIEREIVQVHARPVKDVELAARPPRVLAVDEHRQVYELSENDDESDGELSDGGSDQYPDASDSEDDTVLS